MYMIWYHCKTTNRHMVCQSKKGNNQNDNIDITPNADKAHPQLPNKSKNLPQSPWPCLPEKGVEFKKKALKQAKTPREKRFDLMLLLYDDDDYGLD